MKRPLTKTQLGVLRDLMDAGGTLEFSGAMRRTVNVLGRLGLVKTEYTEGSKYYDKLRVTISVSDRRINKVIEAGGG